MKRVTTITKNITIVNMIITISTVSIIVITIDIIIITIIITMQRPQHRGTLKASHARLDNALACILLT